jgi:polysaccharide biosynthesis/export protein
VTVKGEVRFPGKYSISKRETLCEFIRRAGGFTQDAYLFGTVFSRESVRKREQENIDKIFREFDTLLAELHTSPSYDNDKKLTTQKSANDTFQVIRQLKAPTAVGRMVIDMEKAGRQCTEERGALDYVNLSGGPKELAQREHAFVIQANGEVVSLRSSMSSWTWLSRPENISVTPGSTIVVPLTVDRINGREYTQSLIDTLFKAAVGTIGIKSLLGL